MLAFAQSKPDYDEAKWLEIIRRTWGKMSKNAQAFALSGKIRLPEAAGAADHQGDQSVAGVDETLLHSAHSFTQPAVPFWMNSIG